MSNWQLVNWGEFPTPERDLPNLGEIKKRLADQERRLDELCAEIQSMQAVGPMSGHRIACAVAKAHGMTFRQMIAKQRHKEVVRARQHAMWEMRHHTPLSLPAIGKVLGGLDHTTIIHGIRTHQRRLDNGEYR